MTWRTVAKKDFRDAVRAKSLWALTVLFVLFAGGAAYAYAEIPTLGGAGSAELSAIGLIGFLQSAGAILVPVIGLLVGYKSVVGERESGSIKLLLGLPHTRESVVMGKLVGRTLVVAVPIVVGYVVGGVIGVALLDVFSPVEFVLFTLLTVAFGLAYISISVGFSSAMASESRAAAMAIGLWLVFQFLWSALSLLLLWASNGFSLPAASMAEPPAWFLLFTRLTPNGGYGIATGLLLPDSDFASGYPQWYLQEWFGLVILAFWILVPVALGYWRFRGADL